MQEVHSIGLSSILPLDHRLFFLKDPDSNVTQPVQRRIQPTKMVQKCAIHVVEKIKK